MRRLLPLLFLVLIAPPVRAQSSANVAVRDDFFAPERVTVSVGATVTWTWQGANQHDVKFYDGQGSSPLTTAPYTHRRTFPAAGTYGYNCSVHPASMTGEVVVKAAATGSPKPTTASPRPASKSPTPTPSPTRSATPSRTPSRTPSAAPTTVAPTTVAPTTAAPTTVPPTTPPPALSLDTPVPPDRTGVAIGAGVLVGLTGLGTAALLFLRGRGA